MATRGEVTHLHDVVEAQLHVIVANVDFEASGSFVEADQVILALERELVAAEMPAQCGNALDDSVRGEKAL